MKKINSIIYLMFGAGAIFYGVVALLFPNAIASEAAQSFPLAHILREEGAAAIFIGLMAFWCIFNYERRHGVHLGLMVLTFLLAVIHWGDYFGGHLRWLSPLYNSVPFLALLTMAILSRRSDETKHTSSAVTYPPVGDLLSARQVDKLELEIKSLREKRDWEIVTQLMPIIATLMGVLGFFFTVFVFASQHRMEQEKDRNSREVEQRTRLQNQIRTDTDELLKFTGNQKSAVSRAVFLLQDMDTVLNTKLSDGRTMAYDFREYRESLTKSLMILVRDDCDFNKNPQDVRLANAVAVTWDDYSTYLREEKDFNQLDHILFKYVMALRRFRNTYPGYLESLSLDEKGGYSVGAKYRNQKDEQPRYTNFIDLRDGILRHLEMLNEGKPPERASGLKRTYLEEFEATLCNPVIAKDVLGKDLTNTPCR